jgi:hypothetical protein
MQRFLRAQILKKISEISLLARLDDGHLKDDSIMTPIWSNNKEKSFKTLALCSLSSLI